MKIKCYLSVGDEHVGSTECVYGNNPFTVESSKWCCFKKYASQNMTCSESEKKFGLVASTSFRSVSLFRDVANTFLHVSECYDSL